MDTVKENNGKNIKKEKLNIFMIFWLLFLKRKTASKA